MDKVYDMIILGGGPAGYTAALYAARAGFDTVVIEKMSVGGQMALTGDIDNYPGFENKIFTECLLPLTTLSAIMERIIG